MIYAITLNPAIDSIIETNEFNINQTNYYQNKYEVIGGKGINVGVLLNNLNDNVIITGILGEENKAPFINKFNEINIHNRFVMFEGKTRTNYKIKNLSIKSETELNGEGTKFDTKYIDQLLTYLKDNLKNDDIVVASGSVPKHIDEDIYEKIGKLTNEKNATFILDSSKNWLLKALKEKPFLIKPNIDEVCQILNKPIKEYEFEDIKNMINEIKKMGARNILLSQGGDGSIYFSEDGKIYKVNTANGKLVNSVGAGDSMVGGFVHGLANKLSIEETLKYAAASGAATAFTEWIGEKNEINNLINQIKVKEIN